MLSLPLLIGILCAAAFVWFWQNSLSAREHANRAAIDACTRMNLQFLDGTVAFARLRLARNDRGQISLRRTYIFDYTATSIERHQGFVVLLGLSVESIGFEPDRMPPRIDTRAEHTSLDHHSSNVLDLEEWRQRRRNHPKLSDDRSIPGDASPSSDNKPGDNGW
jgi:Protein of unknown function (DUF3301)